MYIGSREANPPYSSYRPSIAQYVQRFVGIGGGLVYAAACMDSDLTTIASRLGLLAAVVLAGWFARRRNWLGDPATRVLGLLCVDVFLPCLTFTQMLRIVKRELLLEQGSVLLVGCVLMAVPLLAGRWLSRAETPERRPTTWLAMAMPNWIFLPLPVASLLYGEAGVATVLLVNIVAQFFLWTTCIGILRGFRVTASVGIRRALNPGLLATLAGAALALAWPGAFSRLEDTPVAGHLLGLVALAGTLTIPLSMLVTGAQLGALPRRWRVDATALRVLAGRLVIAPLLTTAVLMGLSASLPLPGDIWRTAVLIAAMPVAVSCGVLVERFGGDRIAVAQAILVTTVASLATAPLFVLFAARLF